MVPELFPPQPVTFLNQIPASEFRRLTCLCRQVAQVLLPDCGIRWARTGPLSDIDRSATVIHLLPPVSLSTPVKRRSFRILTLPASRDTGLLLCHRVPGSTHFLQAP